MDVFMPGGDPGGLVITGLGPGPDLRVKVPYAIVRRHGTSAEFVAVFVPEPAGARSLSVTKDGNGIHIGSSAWTDTIELGTTVAYHRALRQ